MDSRRGNFNIQEYESRIKFDKLGTDVDSGNKTISEVLQFLNLFSLVISVFSFN